MKVSLIGPGINPIPPTGWGAVEILVWDYATIMRENGWDVQIVNTGDRNQIINEINSFSPDFVHLQYDNFIDALDGINCPHKAATSHFGYLEQYDRHGSYRPVFEQFLAHSCRIFALSQGIADMYISKGCDPNRITVTPNGARDDNFRYDENCAESHKSVCVGKVEFRKRQGMIMHYNANVDFAGNYWNSDFNQSSPHYLGEWTKPDLYDRLTNYANLVLLSDGEAHPLVCCEALIAGCGLVVSQFSCGNLDTSKDFIDVVTEDKLGDRNYMRSVIEENRAKSVEMRSEIRQYGMENFSYRNMIVPRYMKIVEGIVNG